MRRIENDVNDVYVTFMESKENEECRLNTDD